MTAITDEFMRGMLAEARPYTVVLLKKASSYGEPDARAVIWEHGRRNFSLRAEGLLAIVCPIADDGQWAGVGIFTSPPDETARILDDDPAIKAGVLSYEIHPSVSFPGDSLPAMPAAGQ
jgi:hypothetical protein